MPEPRRSPAFAAFSDLTSDSEAEVDLTKAELGEDAPTPTGSDPPRQYVQVRPIDSFQLEQLRKSHEIFQQKYDDLCQRQEAFQKERQDAYATENKKKHPHLIVVILIAITTGKWCFQVIIASAWRKILQCRSFRKAYFKTLCVITSVVIISLSKITPLYE